jgi:hypothetical protein
LKLQRLPSIGSDHHPILIELVYAPEEAARQSKPSREAGDEHEAQRKLDETTQDGAAGDRSPSHPADEG